jgi:hypothetical protein
MVGLLVIPAKAGIQGQKFQQPPWTPLSRGGDEKGTSSRALRVAGPTAFAEGQPPVS